MNSRKPRVLFVRRSHDTSYPYAGGLPLAGGLPRSTVVDGEQLQANFGQTGNKGSMAISEALIRMFDIDRPHSCRLNLPDLLSLGWDFERVSSSVRKHFDLVVFGMENAIRRDSAAPQEKPLRDQARTLLSKLKKRLRP